MMTPFWLALLLFAIAVALLALYGLTVSGHFPAEFRKPRLRTGIGAIVIWSTLVTTGAAAIVALAGALRVLPWTAIIIGGGAMLLAAPLVLRWFPDRFVDGPQALLGFAGGAMLAAIVLWTIPSWGAL
jgi:hypothetical protein